jgi:hypothetical protein
VTSDPYSTGVPDDIFPFGAGREIFSLHLF